MRFEELAVRAGRVAAEVGRQTARPAIGWVQARNRKRIVIAGAALVSMAAVILVGVALVRPDAESGPQPPAAPSETPAPTTAAPLTRDACPITRPGDTPFQPAAAMPEGSPDLYNSSWFGTPELWTMVLLDGQEWHGLPTNADGNLVQKTFWWSEDFVLMYELAPKITVSLERLDGTDPVVEAGNPGTNGTHPDLGEFMLVGLEIPEAGCWTVTAEYREATLSYVVWVGESD